MHILFVTNISSEKQQLKKMWNILGLTRMPGKAVLTGRGKC